MDFDFKPENYPTKHPADETLTIKLLFTAVVVLFAIIILILALYIYARCCIIRSRRQQLHNRRRRQIVIYMDSNTPTSTAAVRGLDSSVLNSLPVFEYSKETHNQLPECAVCLSEFEENDKGRLLPKCNHSFHIDCIDMWFHSHSTCPLCRSIVEPVVLDHVVVSVDDNSEVAEPGPSERRKNLGLAVMVPPIRGLNFMENNNEISQNSPASQSQSQTQGFKSPLTTRFLSMTRNRRSAAGTTPSGVGSSCGPHDQYVLDVDKGVDESTQYQSRAQTPR